MENESLIIGNSNWAVKANSLLGYAIGEASGKYVPREFTFTRGSTATYTDENGIIQTAAVDIARVQNNALLLEPQRTNIALWSEDLTQTAWAKTNSGTITANTTISPDGTQTADTLTAGAVSGQVQQAPTGTSGAVYTVSIWVKRITGTGNVFLRAVENSDTLIAVTSNWQRFTATVTSTTTTIRIGVKLATSGDEVAIWGGQIELGAYLTTYIPTTSSSATRVADACIKTGISSLIGQTEGVLFVDVYFTQASSAGFRAFFCLEGSVSSQFSGFVVATTNNGNNVNYAGTSYDLTTGRHKIACTYSQANNQRKLFVDGVLRSTSTHTNFLAIIDRVSIGCRINPFSSFNTDRELVSGILHFATYPELVSDSELVTLTTL